jgi:hypothetical protein
MELKHQSLREEVYSPSLPVRLDYGLDDRVLVHLDSFKINPTYNSDGLINCLRQRQDRFVINPQFYALKLFTIY